MSKPWPNERVARLLRLTDQGFTAKEIAHELGVTDNAVRKKLYQLGRAHSSRRPSPPRLLSHSKNHPATRS